jgi:hypothetical protein
MGCAFNAVIAPKKVQTKKDLLAFYEKHKEKLLEKYGEEFEGYSGDMASDDGTLLVKDLKLEVETKKEIKNLDEYWEGLLSLCTGHCEKWGPSIAVRIGGQWAICGAYSD